MLPPTFANMQRVPITSATALAAIAVTLLWMAGHTPSVLFIDPVLLPTQPWRLVSSVLPHVSIFHLAFNVYWLWIFGSFLEPHFGHLRFFLLLLFLAAFSAAAEFAFLDGGVGLSGVGYGLFGMLWVLRRKNPKFLSALNHQTELIFIAWFFLCIATTYTHIMPVANIAHAAGALAGALIAMNCAPAKRRPLAIAALFAFTALITTAATIGRPLANFGDGGSAYAIAGYNNLTHGQFDDAIENLTYALRFRNSDPSTWYNTGIAYQRNNDFAHAGYYFEQAVKRDPYNSDYANALSNFPPATP